MGFAPQLVVVDRIKLAYIGCSGELDLLEWNTGAVTARVRSKLVGIFCRGAELTQREDKSRGAVWLSDLAGWLASELDVTPAPKSTKAVSN